MYNLFQKVREDDSSTTGLNEANVASIAAIIPRRRQWVSKIIKYLFKFAGYHETVSWDGFLFVLLQFCTVSKVEMCQVMFFIIALEMKSWTVHYLTSTQLDEFYSFYNHCPVKSFDVTVDFARLSLAKYRMSDFIELCFRFSQLVNPAMHLQQELRKGLPDLNFWLEYDSMHVNSRRIAIDFFRYKKVRSFADLIAKAGMRDAAVMEGSSNDVSSGQWYRKGFVALPLGPPQPPRTLRSTAEELPEWMAQHLQENWDPLRGAALGSAAEAAKPVEVPPALQEGWVAVPDPTTPEQLYYWNRLTNQVAWTPPAATPRLSVKDAKELIKQTMGAPLQRVRPGVFAEGLTVRPSAREFAVRKEAMARTMELDFVRKARYGEAKRDDIVSILERASPCELIERPA